MDELLGNRTIEDLKRYINEDIWKLFRGYGAKDESMILYWCLYQDLVKVQDEYAFEVSKLFNYDYRHGLSRTVRNCLKKMCNYNMAFCNYVMAVYYNHGYWSNKRKRLKYMYRAIELGCDYALVYTIIHTRYEELPDTLKHIVKLMPNLSLRLREVQHIFNRVPIEMYHPTSSGKSRGLHGWASLVEEHHETVKRLEEIEPLYRLYKNHHKYAFLESGYFLTKDNNKNHFKQEKKVRKRSNSI
jgi:hypothetical protein